jgi:DNA-3-methyladenine glycosylase I
MNRCSWANNVSEKYKKYHDDEWGIPVHEDRKHFEMLCLEGAQAGLSWETILNKREGYRKLFHNFDAEKCSQMTDEYLLEILTDPSIVRNRLKVFSVRKNAVAFLKIQQEFQSFDKYIWSYVNNTPILRLSNQNEFIAKSEISDLISKDLKKRGMSFVGSTIIYAYMQAVGIVNDHAKDCFKYIR